MPRREQPLLRRLTLHLEQRTQRMSHTLHRRIILSVLALSLGACTSVGQVQEDLADTRKTIKRSAETISLQTNWRDIARWQIEQDRFEAYRAEARRLALEGDFTSAEQHWRLTIQNLDAYTPTLDKLEQTEKVVVKVQGLSDRRRARKAERRGR